MKLFVFFLFAVIPALSFAQNNNLHTFRITSSHTSFPDTARAKGHLYDKVLYDAASHYSDSSVLIFAPKKLKAGANVDLIFWFHGWFNKIDSAASRFKLIQQFAAAGSNAVLVLAETTKDAPDSYGGKLENNNVFTRLVTDVLQKLKKENVISRSCKPGNILLAGHSGAYRVMAHILQNGNLPVQEVILFDALYGQTDKFLNWIQSDNTRRFIDIYTNGGGTDGESKELVKTLARLNIPADTTEEEYLTVQMLKARRIIFIHSLHLHNDIINNPDNFQFFLENSPFLKKIKR